MCGNRRICFHSDVKYNNPIISAVCIQGVMKSSFNVFAYLWSLNRHVASFFQLGGGGGGRGLIQTHPKFLDKRKKDQFHKSKKTLSEKGGGKTYKNFDFNARHPLLPDASCLQSGHGPVV